MADAVNPMPGMEVAVNADVPSAKVEITVHGDALPAGGSAGDVLTRTETGTEWKGISAAAGGYYTPSVSESGELRWTPSGSDMPAVAPANIRGPKGDTGATGPEGPAGEQGPAGDTGPAGPAGERGPAGDPGPAGPAGERGPAGEIGPAGERGPAGPAGSDGVSATHSWSGTTLTVASASGTSSADLRGPKGDTGPAGADGRDGYTPVKGVDYFTDADKNELVAAVLNALPAAEGASY